MALPERRGGMVEWLDGGGGGGGEDLKCLTVLFLDQTHTSAGLHTPDARHNQHSRICNSGILYHTTS